MKKLLLLLMMMLPPIVASAFSGVVEIDGIKYEISTKEQTANVTGPSSIDIAGALIIPSSIEYEGKTCYVKSVGGFTSCTGITSVTISEGIEIINYNAFKNCTNLESIILGKSVKEVGRSAFDGTAWYNSQEDGLLCLGHVAIQYKGDMTKDAEITIKEGITIIANSCFSGCNNLKRIHFPESLISIGQYSFSECTSLTTVSLHNVEVHYNAFRKCTSLKAVSLDDVKFVPNIVISGTMQIQDADFFSGSNSIDMVEINCKEIDDWFREKPLITKVTLGDKVEVINPGAFNGCTGIKQIEFPNSVKYLSGFSGCTGIASISIPASVETIGESAFDDCTGITSLNMPANVKEIGWSAFNGCSGITSIKFSEGLKKIGGRAFSHCSSLTSIVIPNTVDTIGDSFIDATFYDCSELKSIELPNNLKYLGEATFQNCNALTTISLPEGLTTISPALFYCCEKINYVTIPSSVKAVYGDAFYRCKDLEDVYCYAPTVPSCEYAKGRGDDPFARADIQYATLHVPAQSIESYKTAKYWQDFKEIVAIPDYEVKKCATPTISYSGGRLSFTCPTEGAQFVSEITDKDIKKSTESNIDLIVTYNISVYATAPDHAMSDIAYATLCWIDQQPQTEGITNGVANVPAQAVLIQSNGGVLTVEGVEDATQVSVYTTNGSQAGAAVSQNGQAIVGTDLHPGSVAIVKIGQKAVKVVVR